MSTTAPPRSRPKDFFTGIGLLGKGLGMYARSPGLILLGMLPALIAFVLLVTAFVLLVYFIQPETRALTWFADGWPKDAQDLVRLFAAVAVIGVGGFLAIIVYTGLTLLIGDPFYEKISERVEARLGGIPGGAVDLDRKSTRLNSSHSQISYAVFCLKKKRNISRAAFYLT